MRSKITALILSAALSGCAVTVPVVGNFAGQSTDDFMGSATAGVGDGTMQIMSQQGVSCTGTLHRPSTVSGTGTLKCDDGRTGTFVFTKSNYNGGTGFGKLSDGTKVRFSFGTDVHRATTRCDQNGSSTTCTQY
ncbi:hypothetical protein ABS755_07975 [Castellaniella sp. FW104-16D08]|uniref:hypothetical protein n=1 Tax=unclassified Castellaniella TaxID=2617606 RepID=UPI003314932E